MKSEEDNEKDFLTSQPIHPGRALKLFLMDKQGYDSSSLADATGLQKDYIDSLVNLTKPINSTSATKLSIVFGSAANTLYKMQFSYDYYLEHGERPSPEQISEINIDFVKSERIKGVKL